MTRTTWPRFTSTAAPWRAAISIVSMIFPATGSRPVSATRRRSSILELLSPAHGTRVDSLLGRPGLDAGPARRPARDAGHADARGLCSKTPHAHERSGDRWTLRFERRLRRRSPGSGGGWEGGGAPSE